MYSEMAVTRLLRPMPRGHEDELVCRRARSRDKLAQTSSATLARARVGAISRRVEADGQGEEVDGRAARGALRGHERRGREDREERRRAVLFVSCDRGPGY